MLRGYLLSLSDWNYPGNRETHELDLSFFSTNFSETNSDSVMSVLIIIMKRSVVMESTEMCQNFYAVPSSMDLYRHRRRLQIIG